MKGTPYINVLEKQPRLNHVYDNLVTKTPLKVNNQTNGVVISFLSGQNLSKIQNNKL